MSLRYLPLLLPASALAASPVYYDCFANDGSHYQSSERCQKGDSERKRYDQSPAAELQSIRLGSNQHSGLIRLAVGHGGHYFASCLVNGVPLRFMIDTGATTVALSASAALRLGLDLKSGEMQMVQTANGPSSVIGITLGSIELQGQKIQSVAAQILSKDLGNEDGLLGMSFLRHFEINSDGTTMTLRRK